MKYNLVEGLNMYANTTVGNVSLTVSERDDIASLSGTKTLNWADNDILCLDCELGIRINVDQVRYYFSTATVSGTVLPSISFYYKQENFDNFLPLAGYIGDGFYYATVSGSSTPLSARIIHTVSGTTISGILQGLSIRNDDTIVDFGATGSATSEAISATVLGNGESIKTIPIYNSGVDISTAYTTIEPQGTNADDLLSISASSIGPWVGVRQNDQRIADKDTVDWDRGNFSNTELDVQNRLVLSAGQSEGTYTTKIFSNEDRMSFVDIYMSPDSPSDAMVTKDVNKNIQTIELRYSNTKPEDYSLYRIFYRRASGISYWMGHKDYYRQNDVLAHTSADLYQDSHGSQRNWFVHVDNNTGQSVSLLLTSHQGPGLPIGCKLNFVVYNLDGTFSYNVPTGYTDIFSGTGSGSSCFDTGFYNLLLDVDGGVWMYIYCEFTTDQGTSWVNTTGYYLAHFNSSFTETFKVYSQGNFLYDCDVIYNNRRLWYTNIDTNQVILIDDDGTFRLQYYDSEGAVRGVCYAGVDNDCWFVSYDATTETTNLIRINESGIVQNTIENVGGVNLTYVKIDGIDALYILDGDYVKRINLSGDVDFSVYVPNADRIHPINAGVWVKTTDGFWRFVDKTTKAIEKSINHSTTPGFIDHSYVDDDSFSTSLFPVTAVDSTWDNLEWREVRPDRYPLTMGNTYHQVRVTLREGAGSVSPIVNGLYVQKSVELSSIYPNNYKNLYLKAEVPDSDLSWTGNYSSNIRTWWEIPE